MDMNTLHTLACFMWERMRCPGCGYSCLLCLFGFNPYASKDDEFYFLCPVCVDAVSTPKGCAYDPM